MYNSPKSRAGPPQGTHNNTNPKPWPLPFLLKGHICQYKATNYTLLLRLLMAGCQPARAASKLPSPLV